MTSKPQISPVFTFSCSMHRVPGHIPHAKMCGKSIIINDYSLIFSPDLMRSDKNDGERRASWDKDRSVERRLHLLSRAWEPIAYIFGTRPDSIRYVRVPPVKVFYFGNPIPTLFIDINARFSFSGPPSGSVTHRPVHFKNFFWLTHFWLITHGDFL